MEILLKLNEEIEIQQLDAYYFKSLHINKTIFPIPFFVENPICNCGNEALFLTEDYIFLCNKCLNSAFGLTELFVKKEFNVPFTKQIIKSLNFLWKPINKNVFYNIHGRNIIYDDFSKILFKFKTMLLKRKEVCFEGEYFKEQKKLKLIN